MASEGFLAFPLWVQADPSSSGHHLIAQACQGGGGTSGISLSYQDIDRFPRGALFPPTHLLQAYSSVSLA